MDHTPQVIFSNSITSLINQLKKNLYYSETKFSRKLVILPSDNAKDEIMKACLEDEQIAIGIRFVNLNLAMDHLLTITKERKQELFFPRKEILSFLIQKILKELEVEESVIKKYLNQKLHREIELSDVLAEIFMEYAIYGEKDFLPKEHFQAKIEKRIYEVFDHPQEVIYSLKENFFSEIGMEIHLFGFVHIPKLYLDFFLAASAIWNTSFYTFSPSPLFWGDLLSERKTLFYQKQVKDRGINYNERKTLADYLKVDNPIMNECVEAAKGFYLYAEDHNLISIEEYVERKRVSVLSTIQQDVVEITKTSVDGQDQSIQLHIAPNRLREIEAIKGCVDHLVSSYQYKSGDIAIYAPDIKQYLPYIAYVFGKDSVFGYSIEDLPKSEESPLIHSFLQMLNLPDSLFSKEDIFEIFRCKAALLKMGITEEEFEEIEKKATESKVRWGFDDAHKEKLGMHGDNRGTWDYVLKQWVISLSVMESDYHLTDNYNIGLFCSFDLGVAIGKFLHALKLLYRDFNDLSSQKKTLSDWSEYFYQIVHRYFDVAAIDDLQSDFKTICNELQRIKQWSHLVEEELYFYDSFKKRIIEMITKLKGTKRSLDERERLQFETLKVGNIREKKAVFLMGFDEESFPRKEEKSALNLLDHRKQNIPSSLQIDKFLFLQLLLNAKDHLIFSYSNATEDPNSLLQASSMMHLLSGYPIKKYQHSGFGFTKSYFNNEAFFTNHSEGDFRLAQKYYYRQRPKKEIFDYKEEGVVKNEIRKITLSQLRRFALHPLKYYMNHNLGIFLQQEEEVLDSEEFFLSYSLKHKVIKEGIKEDLPRVIEKLKLSGRFPSGVFEQMTLYEIEKEIKPALRLIREFKKEKTFSIQFEERIKEPCFETEDLYLYPAIELFVGENKVIISGRIEDAGEKSIYPYRNSSFEDLMKIWPEVLCYKVCMPKAESIGCLKDLKHIPIHTVDAMELLKEYVSYFLMFENRPSFLLPQWAKHLLIKDKEAIAQKVASSFDATGMFMDQYLLWMFKGVEQIFANNSYIEQVESTRQNLKGLKDWYETV